MLLFLNVLVLLYLPRLPLPHPLPQPLPQPLPLPLPQPLPLPLPQPLLKVEEEDVNVPKNPKNNTMR
jgi:hypothetical protein